MEPPVKIHRIVATMPGGSDEFAELPLIDEQARMYRWLRQQGCQWFEGSGIWRSAHRLDREVFAAMQADTVFKDADYLAENVAHHGPPILTGREATICEAMVRWIETVRADYGPGWLPSRVDIEKSRLFWRLRSGKDPLPHRPPTAYSCPWYEVIDQPERPHWAYEVYAGPHPLLGDRGCSIAQCSYGIVERGHDGKPSVVSFGPWRFRVFEGPGPEFTQRTDDAKPFSGWWIQLVTPVAETQGEHA